MPCSRHNGGGVGGTASGGSAGCGGGASDFALADQFGDRVVVAAGGGGMGGGNTDANAGEGGCNAGGEGDSPFGEEVWTSRIGVQRRAGFHGDEGELGMVEVVPLTLAGVGPGGGGGGGYYGGGGGGSDCFASGTLGGGGGGGGSSPDYMRRWKRLRTRLNRHHAYWRCRFGDRTHSSAIL